MTHWSNFPATSSMTDFEVIVVQNEQARWERINGGQEEVIIPEESQYTEDDTMILNIFAKSGPDPIPIPITPIHPTPTPPMEPIFQPQDDVESLSSPSTNEDNIVEDDIDLNDITTKEDLSTNSGSSGSYKSVPSSNSSPKLAIIIQELHERQLKKKKSLPFRDNTTVFMEDINNMNVNNTRRTILISAVRPRFQCRIHNEFFVCHVCHKKPVQIKLSEKLWDIALEKNDDKLGDELPFVYNLRGIIDHLTNFHCLTHEDKSRDMILAVANYIDMVNTDIEEATSTMFSSSMFPEKSILKASSTSCLRVSWKSNQTDLTTELAHTYNFQEHTTFCKGHPKLKFNATHGKAYALDLADTVYCSCSAIPIKFGTMDFQNKPAAKIIFDPTLNILQEKTFFNLEKKSICQSHATVLCYYKLIQPIPKFPKRTYKPKKPITRKDTREKMAEENYKDESSKKPTDNDNDSRREKQIPMNKQVASCQVSPPGETRLRPEGKSPPLPSPAQLEGCGQHVPPPPTQEQPPTYSHAGNSVKATVSHAMATAASLLKRPARKSDWV